MSEHIKTLRLIFVGFTSLIIAVGIGRFVYTPLLPLMRDDGLISATDGGLLATFHFIGYWLGAVFASKLPFSPKQTLRLSLITIAISTVGMGVTDNLSLWILLRWIAGICSAFVLILISTYYVKHLTEMGKVGSQGWIFSGVGAGIAFSGLGTLILMVYDIESPVSWELFGGIALIAVTILCLLIGPEIPNHTKQAYLQKTTKSSLNWQLLITYCMAGLGYIIPATYLPIMAQEIITDPLVFGWSWPIFGLAACISTLISTRLFHYYSNRQIWAASQIIMAVGLVLPVLFQNIEAVILSAICIGGTFMIITMVGIREIHRIVPKTDALRHIAFMTAAFATGQMIGPLIASLAFELSLDFNATLLFVSFLLILTTPLLKRNQAKEMTIGIS